MAQRQTSIDYHVQVDWHCYSVPYRLANPVCGCASWQPGRGDILPRPTVACMRAITSVAAIRRTQPIGPKLISVTEWTPSRLVRWSSHEVGPYCGQAVTHLLAVNHTGTEIPRLMGILRLRRHYGVARLESAVGALCCWMLAATRASSRYSPQRRPAGPAGNGCAGEVTRRSDMQTCVVRPTAVGPPYDEQSGKEGGISRRGVICRAPRYRNHANNG